MKKLFVQITKFGLLGLLVTLLDFFLVYLFHTVMELGILLATFLAYILSFFVNYVVSVFWVFDTDGNHKKNGIVFVALSIIALFITESIMWIGTRVFPVHYMLVKVVATVVVNVFNFVSRKFFLERWRKDRRIMS